MRVYVAVTAESPAAFAVVSRYDSIPGAKWPDTTTPRTERPVRFTVQTYDGEYLNPLRPLRHA